MTSTNHLSLHPTHARAPTSDTLKPALDGTSGLRRRRPAQSSSPSPAEGARQMVAMGRALEPAPSTDIWLTLPPSSAGSHTIRPERLGARAMGQAVQRMFGVDRRLGRIWGEGLVGAGTVFMAGSLGFYVINGVQPLVGQEPCPSVPWPLAACLAGALYAQVVSWGQAHAQAQGAPLTWTVAYEQAHDLSLVTGAFLGCWAAVVCLVSRPDAPWRLAGHAAALLNGAAVAMYACQRLLLPPA